jgi:CII-binding regulator of phage lambda lysogenization HflD
MRVQESDAVIPFTPASTNAVSGKADQLDDAGQTLLQLVQKAAGVAEQDNKHALGIAQRFSQQLRAAEDRIAELEARAAAYQQQVECAEQWLHRVYTEIEDRFLRQGAPQRR